MSYILDALKKVEHEKSRKSRRDGMFNISGALFENERPKPSGTAGWKIALAVTAAVLVTFTATWQFLNSGQGRGNTSAHLATPAPRIPPVKIETAPAPPVPPVVPVQQAPLPAPPAPAVVAPVRPPDHSLKPQKVVAPVAAAAAELTRTRQKERKGQEAPADPANAAPADIKLSGIAWQEDRHARRAVVNGFLMQEGGVVSGAKLTDIYQDRVRFSQSGKIFEIPLVSSGVSAAGK